MFHFDVQVFLCVLCVLCVCAFHMALLIHATVTITGEEVARAACEARLRRLLSSQFLKDEVALECADVLLYLIRLCDKLGIDLAAAAGKKLVLNAQKYPVEKARGKMTKYDKL